MIEFIIEVIVKSLSTYPWIWAITTLLGILALLMKIYYKNYRGKWGEHWVKEELIKLPQGYYVLNDIMIKTNNNTHQIDHIVISKYGIFVIEMKNYYGLIIGNEHNKEWAQRIGVNKYNFKNPIYQNYGHVQALKEVLNIDERIFIPIICFSNQAKLVVESNKIVIQLDDLKRVILSYNNEIFCGDLINIKEKLIQLNIVDRKQRKEHVSKIRVNIRDQNRKINNKICPKCGGTLIDRNGKYGKFIGCNNYPKCKFTKK